MKKTILRIVFFFGWLLSPFTFWNDVFVNIPISYLCANIFIRIWPAPYHNGEGQANFLLTVLVFYWLSNGLGLLIMYASGKNLLTGKKAFREILLLVITLVGYSLVLVLLQKIGILKPL